MFHNPNHIRKKLFYAVQTYEICSQPVTCRFCDIHHTHNRLRRENVFPGESLQNISRATFFHKDCSDIGRVRLFPGVWRIRNPGWRQSLAFYLKHKNQLIKVAMSIRYLGDEICEESRLTLHFSFYIDALYRLIIYLNLLHQVIKTLVSLNKLK